MGVEEQLNLDYLHGLDHCATLATKDNVKWENYYIRRCLKLVELYSS